MAGQADLQRWVLTRPSGEGAMEPLPGGASTGPGCDGCWESLDGTLLRMYSQAADQPGAAWRRLQQVQEIAGASAGQAAPFHYVVETDVTPEHAQQLSDWYAQEHLPGLAAVPGTVRAARYLCLDGEVPRSVACYDLTTPDTLQSVAWLAVRHTEWSSRVRPLFRNPMRTMFRRVSGPAKPAHRI